MSPSMESPALLTRTCSPPSLPVTSSIPAAQAAGSPTSNFKVCTFGAPEISERLEVGVHVVVFLCTRTDDIESALGPAAPRLAKGGAVVCVQNGLPEERAARIVGEDRVLGAVIGWSANATGPGEYR